MNNAAVKTGILVFYIVLLSRIMGFDIRLMLSLPFFIMVISGALLLALLSCQKGSGAREFLHKLKFMFLVSGGLTAFFANIAFLSASSIDAAGLYSGAVHIFLPLFYGFLFYFVLDLFRFRKTTAAAGMPPEHEATQQDRLEDYDLTRREIAVSREILEHLSNGEIAAKLFISENTVKKHINHIFQKVGVRNRAEFILKFNRRSSDRRSSGA